MSVNRENLALVKEEFRLKNLKAKEEATARMREIEERFPELSGVHAKFAQIGERMMAGAFDRTKTVEERKQYIESLREEASRLSEERAAVLTANGYPADYTAPRYECEKCEDTGYVNSVMCTCMRRALVLKGFESSGIANLIEKQSFESFSLDYYTGKARENAAIILEVCREFADKFSRDSGNILLMGGTGLGKTHLSTSIARAVIEKGYDVVYESAGNVFHDFESEQFGSRRDERGVRTSRYFDCDLLVIDDLGTEMGGQFNNHCLYHLINERLLKRLPTVISSNLSEPKDIAQRYNDRIVSRLLGEYLTFRLDGVDVRAQRLRENG